MRTRSIVTSQPDVACDVCERRLLRGEQPEVFLAAGTPRTVCELCAPRAAHEGWLRGSEHEPLVIPPPRPRRGRSLFERLRHVGKTAELPGRDRAPGPPLELEPDGGLEARTASAPYAAPERALEAGPYDFRETPATIAEEPIRTLTADPARDPGPAEDRDLESEAIDARSSEPESAPVGEVDLLQRAIDQFNASEYPRRVAGVARSLGAPAVGVRPDEYLQNAATIVIAWDLCWYRYEILLDDGVADTRLDAQGTELDQLAREDRLVNAVAEETGALSLAGS